MKTLSLLFSLILTSTAVFAEWECLDENITKSFCGQAYSKTIQCAGTTVSLEANFQYNQKPTLTVGNTIFHLSEGMDYNGPFCMKYRGKRVVGYTEYAGNAYEVYHVVDPDTFKTTEVNPATAQKLGFYNN